MSVEVVEYDEEVESCTDTVLEVEDCLMGIITDILKEQDNG